MSESSHSPAVGAGKPAPTNASPEPSQTDSEMMATDPVVTTQQATQQTLEQVIYPTVTPLPDVLVQSESETYINESIAADTLYNIIPAAWLKGWGSFIHEKTTSPPPMIDTTHLVDSINPQVVQLKKQLLEGQDYEIIPNLVWKRLVAWYGCKGPEILRKSSTGTSRLPSVSLHPLTLPITLLVYSGIDLPAEVEAKVSKISAPASSSPTPTQHQKKDWITWFAYPSQTISEFKADLASQLKVAPATLKLWDYYSPAQIVVLDESQTLAGANIVEGNGILVEYEHPTEKKFLFEGPQRQSYQYGYNGAYSSSNYSSQPRQVLPGKQGLGNLGNTCFMNSSLQCLSSCVPLTDFFLSGKYIQDINRDNPIGAKGLIAQAYGKLLQELWSSTSTSSSRYYHHAVEPAQVKATIERFAPQFSGYSQHDSQELMAFLLDGLHEDLNRILRKPYVEGVTGKPEDLDEEIAKKAWDGHKQRNDSVIVDHFQGQLKSKVTCPVCENVSITFDPFMYLSLPLPVDTSKWIKVVYIPVGGRPSRHAIKMKQNDTVAHLFRELSAQLNQLEKLRKESESDEEEAKEEQEVEPIELTRENVVLCELNYGAFYDRKAFNTGAESLDTRETYFAYQLLSSELEEPEQNAEQTEESEESDHQPAPSDSDEEEVVNGKWAYLPTTITYGETYGYSNHVVWTKSPFPLVLSAPAHCTYAELYNRICDHLNPFLRKELPTYEAVMADYQESVRIYEEEQARKKAAEEAEDQQAELGQPEEKAEDSDREVPARSPPSSGEELDDVEAADSDDSDDDMRRSRRDQFIYGGRTTGTATTRPPLQAPPVAPPAFPFSIHFSERYKSSKILDPTSPQVLRFPSSEDITYSIAFANKHIYTSYIDEALMKTVDDHPSINLSMARTEDHPLPLRDCLDLFTTEEKLTEDNMWYCGVCKEHVTATKKLELWSLPRILVIHLKRFHYLNKHRREKIGTLVEFPLQDLDLSPYLLGHLEGTYPTDENQPPASPTYDLFAVSNHYGGLGGGHYTAFARHRDDGNWFYYDDSSVRASQASEVQSTAAYVLFYRRKDVPWDKFDASIINSMVPAAATNQVTTQSSGHSSPSSSSSPPPLSSNSMQYAGRIRSYPPQDSSDSDVAQETDSSGEPVLPDNTATVDSDDAGSDDEDEAVGAGMPPRRTRYTESTEGEDTSLLAGPARTEDMDIDSS